MDTATGMNFTIDEKLRKELIEFCKTRDTNRSRVVRQALRRFFSQQKKGEKNNEL